MNLTAPSNWRSSTPTVLYRPTEVLVDTDWVAQHVGEPGVRVVEVDVDTAAYEAGHIPGAAAWHWTAQLHDRRIRAIRPRPKAELEVLVGGTGITRDTTVVLYGDHDNWFAAWALWQLKVYGHADVRLMDGGRRRWIAEGRELVSGQPTLQPKRYRADEPNFAIQAFRADVLALLGHPHLALVDVRSPAEFSGTAAAAGWVEGRGAQRRGHIPGAVNIPWSSTCKEDGTFKSAGELRRLYAAAGVTEDKAVITYCQFGERSAHSWFVLACLLGYPNVRNYDGSWMEWG